MYASDMELPKNYKSPAEKTAYEILAGVQILQQGYENTTLVAIDKNICCDGLEPNELSEQQQLELKRLGWERDEDGYWTLYIGH
jgi:hypothetical protein